MQNPIQKFRQSSIVFEKPVFFIRKIENFDELQLLQYFLLKLMNVYKKVFGIFFLFCLDLGLFAKQKRPGFYTLVFYTFINNSGSKQDKKNPENPLVDIIK